ncbi:hypothetical protein HK101_002367, partial [Irineochytrium annulatum]
MSLADQAATILQAVAAVNPRAGSAPLTEDGASVTNTPRRAASKKPRNSAAKKSGNRKKPATPANEALEEKPAKTTRTPTRTRAARVSAKVTKSTTASPRPKERNPRAMRSRAAPKRSISEPNDINRQRHKRFASEMESGDVIEAETPAAPAAIVKTLSTVSEPTRRSSRARAPTKRFVEDDEPHVRRPKRARTSSDEEEQVLPPSRVEGKK